MPKPALPTVPSPRDAVFPTRGSHRETLRISTLLRKEAVGGVLLVIMAAAALAASVLTVRNRGYRKLSGQDGPGTDGGRIPGTSQQHEGRH